MAGGLGVDVDTGVDMGVINAHGGDVHMVLEGAHVVEVGLKVKGESP
jgi:hypothetical protein